VRVSSSHPLCRCRLHPTIWIHCFTKWGLGCVLETDVLVPLSFEIGGEQQCEFIMCCRYTSNLKTIDRVRYRRHLLTYFLLLRQIPVVLLRRSTDGTKAYGRLEFSETEPARRITSTENWRCNALLMPREIHRRTTTALRRTMLT